MTDAQLVLANASRFLGDQILDMRDLFAETPPGEWGTAEMTATLLHMRSCAKGLSSLCDLYEFLNEYATTKEQPECR